MKQGRRQEVRQRGHETEDGRKPGSKEKWKKVTEKLKSHGGGEEGKMSRKGWKKKQKESKEEGKNSL